MNKKGVEISMNVIIIAALGLLVLVVLAAIFLGRAGDFGQGAASCEAKGGTCAEECGNPDFGTEDFGKRDPFSKCTTEGDICCLPLNI